MKQDEQPSESDIFVIFDYLISDSSKVVQWYGTYLVQMTQDQQEERLRLKHHPAADTGADSDPDTAPDPDPGPDPDPDPDTGSDTCPGPGPDAAPDPALILGPDLAPVYGKRIPVCSSLNL